MIIIETGRNRVKIIDRDGEKHEFTSKVGTGRDLKLMNERSLMDNLDMVINGQRYFVGELAEESKDMKEMLTPSKIHEETKVLFGAALYFANPLPKDNIITLIPIDQFNPDDKKALVDHLIGQYKIRFNNVIRTFDIKDVEVFPEGATGAWEVAFDDDLRMYKRFAEAKKIRVIDIGSRTVNYATYYKRDNKPMNYLDRESGTLDYGCSMMEDVNDHTFLRKIMGDLSRKWTTLDDLTVFVGGGAIRLKGSIEEEFKNAEFAQDPLFANVFGARKLGWMKYGRS